MFFLALAVCLGALAALHSRTGARSSPIAVLFFFLGGPFLTVILLLAAAFEKASVGGIALVDPGPVRLYGMPVASFFEMMTVVGLVAALIAAAIYTAAIRSELPPWSEVPRTSWPRVRFSLPHIFLLVTLTAGVAAALDYYWPSERNFIRHVFGGRSGVRTVAEPDQALAFRVDSNYRRPFGKLAKNAPVIAGPFVLSEGDAQAIARTLLSYQSYEKGKLLNTAFCPDSKLTFVRGNKMIEVLFDFSSSTLQVFQGDRLISVHTFLAVRDPILAVFNRRFLQEASSK
jgi:hypothetical protein